MDLKIRLLRADEIEVRISSISEKGLSLLLYKDVRADMNLLDETVGAMNWQRTHQMIGDMMFCTLSIWDSDKKQWISKMDVGTAGFTEIEKSQVSDSMKRSGFSWGFGRELYSAPFIWIPSEACSIQKRGDKYVCYDRFSVKEITYSESRVITGLTIINEKTGKVVYRLVDTKKESEKDKKEESAESGKLSKHELKLLDDELKRTGVTFTDVKKRYGLSCTKSEIPPEILKRIMSALSKTSSAA